MAATREPVKPEAGRIVDMSWDPITRIVGNLGIYTKIDFDSRKVVSCKATSSLFRGYSVFMKGKDPRDAHFITSRICGICGDNHAVCSCYAQQMAYGVKPPPLAEWIINLGEAAEYIFDHIIFQDNLVFVDFCEQMVKETNPGVWEKAQRTAAPGVEHHGYKTIADIMTSYNPFTGATYREALHMSRIGREMICLMEGRHVHPSTIYPGGVGTVATPTLLTDYQSRLLRCLDFIKKAVAMNDDVFDFFYEALPGYEEVGRRRVLLNCWGAFNNPNFCTYDYRTMSDWGNEMFVTPGIVVDGELVTTDLVDINLGIRILLGSSYYQDWEGSEEVFVPKDPLGNPVDKRHPWNQTTIPAPQKRDLEGNYSWVMSPRWYDKRTGDNLAMDTGGGALARLWATALANKVHIPFVNATGSSVQITLPKTPDTAADGPRMEDPAVVERDRARPRADLLRGLRRRLRVPLPRQGVRGDPRRPDQDVRGLRRPGRRDRLRLPRGRARRAQPPHGHPRRQDRQLPPVPADAVERLAHRLLRHARPLRGRVQRHADLRGGRRGQLPRHRHHARGPLVRPVPAVRGAHVPRQRQDDQAGALADVRRARMIERVEALLDEVESFPEAQREVTTELVQALLDMYGEGLARIVAADSVPVEDELVAHLLLLHGLHPVPVVERVGGALDEVRPYLVAHGGGVELLGVSDGVVHLRLEGACNGCPSSALTLTSAVEEAIHRAAPDIERIEAEGVKAPSGLLQIEIACPVPLAG